MKQFDADLAAAVSWLVDGCIRSTKRALEHQAKADKVLALAELAAACANLPGDGPLRVRCTPNVFSFKA